MSTTFAETPEHIQLQDQSAVRVRIEEESDFKEARKAVEHIQKCLNNGTEINLQIEHIKTGEATDVPPETIGMFMAELTQLIGSNRIKLVSHIPINSKLGKQLGSQPKEVVKNDGSLCGAYRRWESCSQKE